jgi:hypothetical protein
VPLIALAKYEMIAPDIKAVGLVSVLNAGVTLGFSKNLHHLSGISFIRRKFFTFSE